jgi:hypothetical protein
MAQRLTVSAPGTCLSCLRYDSREDREKLVCFAMKLAYSLVVNGTIIPQQFEPELRFIRFLQQAIQFGTKLRV